MNILAYIKEALKIAKEFEQMGMFKKARWLINISCWIVIAEAINAEYFDILSYIDLPCLPVIARETIWFDKVSLLISMVLMFIFDFAVFELLSNCGDPSKAMKIAYVHKLIMLCGCIYLFLYAVNLFLKYANGVSVDTKVETTVSVVYLLCNWLKVSYNRHREIYELLRRRSTGYFDSNGIEIMEGDYIIYFQRKHKVVRHDSDYLLLPDGEVFISKELTKLSDIYKDSRSRVIH